MFRPVRRPRRAGARLGAVRSRWLPPCAACMRPCHGRLSDRRCRRYRCRRFRRAKREVPATEQRYGGKYVGRGGLTKVLEGDWEPHRLVILEFPDMASLMGWYDSPEYSRLKAIREKC